MPALEARDLARRLDAQLLGPGEVVFHGVDALESAGPGALTFIRSPRFARRWDASRAAGAIITRDVPLADLIPGFDPAAPASPRPLIIVPDADLALIRVLPLFAPAAEPAPPGVHPTAVVHPTARVHATASVGPCCVIGAGASVGEHAVLHSHVTLGAQARIGARTLLHDGVRVLDRCEVGHDCILHAGAVLGADGFGYHPAPDGRGLLKVPHIGAVVVGNHVEIGANACIDRAKFGATTIGDGTKIDNLVQIGHGCRIGRCCILCGHAALAGSVVLGDGVIMGGKAGVADGIEVGAGAKIAASSGVINTVPAGAVYMGNPAGPAGEWRRILAAMRRMGKRPTRVEP